MVIKLIQNSIFIIYPSNNNYNLNNVLSYYYVISIIQRLIVGTITAKRRFEETK